MFDEPADKYLEEWIVVVNGDKYTLTHNQSQTLKQAIAQGSRGLIMFPEFAINIPMIQEFYLKGRILNPKYRLEQPSHLLEEPESKPLTEEEKQRLAKKREELLANFKQKTQPKPRMSQAEFNKKKAEALEMAATLEELEDIKKKTAKKEQVAKSV